VPDVRGLGKMLRHVVLLVADSLLAFNDRNILEPIQDHECLFTQIHLSGVSKHPDSVWWGTTTSQQSKGFSAADTLLMRVV
jgi:hypothetical protein